MSSVYPKLFPLVVMVPLHWITVFLYSIQHLPYVTIAFLMTSFRSDELSLPKALPIGGNGPPALDSDLAPHVTK